MEKDFRYNMLNIGDNFVDKVECLGRLAKRPIRGIVLTYNIDELKKEKDKLIKRMGTRLVAIRKKGSEQNIFNDAIMKKLIDSFDTVQNKIDADIKERKERLYPPKS